MAQYLNFICFAFKISASVVFLFPWASSWCSKIVTRLSRTNNSKLGYLPDSDTWRKWLLPGPVCELRVQNRSAFIHSRPQSLRSFWPAAGIESPGSNHFEITKEITELCPSGLTQSSSMAHARNGCSQSSRFLPQTSRIVGSGDENVFYPEPPVLLIRWGLGMRKRSTICPRAEVLAATRDWLLWKREYYRSPN